MDNPTRLPDEPGAHDSSPSQAASHEAPLHNEPTVRTYYIIYGVLLLLLVLTVAVTELHLGIFGILIALMIAVAKALLVLFYFMHLRYSSRLTWLFASAGFVWLLILFVFLLSDYLTRGWA